MSFHQPWPDHHAPTPLQHRPPLVPAHPPVAPGGAPGRRTPDRAILVDEAGYLTYAGLRSAIEARAAALLRRCRGESPAPAGVCVLRLHSIGLLGYWAPGGIGRDTQ